MNKNNRVRMLLSDSLLFAVSNIGTKLIMFLMVPVYTYYLSTGTYGMVDLYLTTLTMLTPIVTLSVFDAVFRFSLDNGVEKPTIFSNGLVVTIIGGTIVLVLGAILTALVNDFNLLLFSLLLILNSLLSLIQNYLRGSGNKRLFVILGLISSIFTAISTVGLLLIQNNLQSVIIGNSIGFIMAVFVGIGFGKLKFNMKEISVSFISKLLQYSIPLIPNAFAWWFTNNVARFAILYFVGTAGNGIYAVATKIPALITVFFSIFSQAWQISAVNEFNSEDKSKYYSEVFNNLIAI